MKKYINKVFFIHNQVGMLCKRVFLQLSEAQSTGLRRWWQLVLMAARWRCADLKKKTFFL